MEAYLIVICWITVLFFVALLAVETVHLVKAFQKLEEETEREKANPPQVLMVRQEAGEVRFAYITKPKEGSGKKPTIRVSEAEPAPNPAPAPAPAPEPVEMPASQPIRQAEPFFIPMPLFVQQQPSSVSTVKLQDPAPVPQPLTMQIPESTVQEEPVKVEPAPKPRPQPEPEPEPEEEEPTEEENKEDIVLEVFYK